MVELSLAIWSKPAGFVPMTNWFVGDALGIAIMTPLVLAIERTELAQLFSPERRLETVGVLAGMGILSCAIFAQTGLPLAFLLFPGLLLAIFRLGASGSPIRIFLLTAPAAYLTSRGRGPFAYGQSTPLLHRIFFLQCFVGVALVIVYSVSSALRGRERLENELAEAFFEADAYAAQDYITGVANRRTFDSQLKQEWNRMLREHGTLSMLMIDVDHFKLYNDFYGHMAGDECLRKIGSILAGVQRRGGDFVARFGGEEFAVLLPRAYSQGAMALAERIRQSVSDACLQHSPYQAGIVTISVGVGTLQAEESKDEKLLIERADQALYIAKRAGRNQVAVWTDGVGDRT
jgi:diguanylate cyclase (GGDEF)-like protein